MKTIEDYTNLSHDEFVRRLTEKVDEMTGGAVLAVPGVYELMSEHWNNDILDDWKSDQPDVIKLGEDENE
jgi:hypothetical protein